MIMYLRNSLGTAAESGFVPAGLPSYDSALVKGYYYDAAKSRQLLTEAGFPDGNNLPSINCSPFQYMLNWKLTRDNWKYAGIKIQVEVVQKSLLLEQTAKSQAVFFRGS